MVSGSAFTTLPSMGITESIKPPTSVALAEKFIKYQNSQKNILKKNREAQSLLMAVLEAAMMIMVQPFLGGWFTEDGSKKWPRSAKQIWPVDRCHPPTS